MLSVHAKQDIQLTPAFSTAESSLPRMRLKTSSFELPDMPRRQWKSRDDLRQEARQDPSRAASGGLLPADWSGNPGVVRTIAESGRVPVRRDPLANKQLKVQIRDVCAHDLPAVDGGSSAGASGTDPYAIFSILECDADVKSKTGVLEENLNPEWTDQVELIVPAGASAVRSREPLIRITVLDRDLGEDDDEDVLGQAELRLTEVSGAFFRAPMHGFHEVWGKKTDWISYVSFSYEVLDYEPPPSATLVLSMLELGAPRIQAGSKQGHPNLRARFVLPELGDSSAISTPVCMPSTSSFISWDDIVIVLELRPPTARPPTLWVEIISEDFGLTLAAGAVKLPDGNVTKGSMEATLDGREEGDDLSLRFHFQVFEPEQQPEQQPE
uniref:C2 domain-containing protein n=1 Tax=Haptolina brevifila TaxID=156173 RepID=A0A7S2I4S8_9EUKA|mmetsp:Transcript_61211/g.121153  ORF Transcript_61211/g.121153 Transcript_61211/m.121153 type:complete len:383 (+) Transcript_61211:158-1306(+)